MTSKDDSISFFREEAESINRWKYHLLGIKDTEPIKKLIELDFIYFTYMTLYRNDLDDVGNLPLDKTFDNEQEK